MQTSTPMSAPPTPAPSHYTEVLSNTSGHPQALVAAHHRALDISEILDNILVQLPIKDLFVHQRVSKQFQAATKSPACQKKMFLKLSDTARETWRLVPSKKKRGKGRNRWSFKCVEPGSDDDQETTTPVILNPLLEVAWLGAHESASCAQRKRSETPASEQVRVRAVEQSIGTHSSLLNMYISDPPCKVLMVASVFIPPVHGRARSLYSMDVMLQSETGLKLGDIWDGALSASGDRLWKDDNGRMQRVRVDSLRQLLNDVSDRGVILDLPWYLQLVDVVVPTTKEWAAVRQRDARR